MSRSIAAACKHYPKQGDITGNADRVTHQTHGLDLRDGNLLHGFDGGHSHVRGPFWQRQLENQDRATRSGQDTCCRGQRARRSVRRDADWVLSANKQVAGLIPMPRAMETAAGTGSDPVGRGSRDNVASRPIADHDG